MQAVLAKFCTYSNLGLFCWPGYLPYFTEYRIFFLLCKSNIFATTPTNPLESCASILSTPSKGWHHGMF